MGLLPVLAGWRPMRPARMAARKMVTAWEAAPGAMAWPEGRMCGTGGLEKALSHPHKRRHARHAGFGLKHTQALPVLHGSMVRP